MDSALDQLFNFFVSSEIPALYQLVEYTFKTLGLFFLLHSVALLRSVKAVNGTSLTNNMQLLDVSPMEIAAKAFAGAFLFSFGSGNALIANSLFIQQDFAPYSLEVFRSISCANGDGEGCLHTNLGLYEGADWQKQLINANFFELFTAILQITGAIAYGTGWVKVSKIGKPPTSQNHPTLGGCLTQIVLGALFMHPYELWKLLS